MIDELRKLYPGTRIYGPYVREDGRRYFVLADIDGGKVRKHGKKYSLMVSRAMMEIKLGRVLSKNEEVDHINGDRSR